MEKSKGLFSMMSEERKRRVGRIFYEAIMEERRREAMNSSEDKQLDHEMDADGMNAAKNR